MNTNSPTFYFINYGHAGDIILTRPFIKELTATYPDVKLVVECMDRFSYLLADLGLNIVTVKERNEIAHNFAPGLYFFDMSMMAIDAIWQTFGLTHNSIVYTYNYYLKEYGLYERYKIDSRRNVPFNEFPAPSPLPRVRERAVLVENGTALSGQSDIDINEYLQEIAETFPKLNFYCSAKPAFTARNVVDISPLNLIEISEISNACIAFVTKCSGVNAACMTEKNKYKPRCFVGATDALKTYWFWELPENRAILLRDKAVVFEFLTMIDRHSATLPLSAADMARHPDKYRIKLKDYVEDVSFCKFLKSQEEINACTQYLHDSMLHSHVQLNKNWEIAHILSDLSDGNLLDIRSIYSGVLMNAFYKGIPGEKYGIDVNVPTEQATLAHYSVGDICDGVALPDGFFQNICGTSVLGYNADIVKFTREAARLLKIGGMLYLTFNYWEPVINGSAQVYGLECKIFNKAGVLEIIAACQKNRLALTEDVNWALGGPVTRDYTFGLLRFKKI